MSNYAPACEYYDLLYSEIKDYEAEIPRLLEIIRSAPLTVRRILDVGCGPGRHARLLSDAGLDVDGLDLEPGFIRIAQERNPNGRFLVGDMTSLEVSEPYDALICLFGTIGYAVDKTKLHSALACFHSAIRPSGLLIVEPWFEPDDMTDGSIFMHTARRDDLIVCRVARTKVVGAVSRHEFEYLIARPSGIEHLSEVHELGLFPRSAMTEAFEATGFKVEFDPEGLTGRGLYIASKP